jgi:aminoglycoside 3-N-acetyltransferase
MWDISQGSLCTRQSLQADFQRLGIEAGSTILLHSSLSSLGFVVGGAETVVWALLDVIGSKGTLVVPTHSGDNSDPSQWRNPPVPEEWWSRIRGETPAYDPIITRPFTMGIIADTVRTWPGALRSGHPQTSFAAVGPNAEQVTACHAWDSALGEKSPLARLEELEAQILLLGVGYGKCTAFHLAEYRLKGPLVDNSFAAMTEDGRRWITVQERRVDGSDFDRLGRDYEATPLSRVRRGKIGDSESRLFHLGQAVKFAENWLPGRTPAGG